VVAVVVVGVVAVVVVAVVVVGVVVVAVVVVAVVVFGAADCNMRLTVPVYELQVMLSYLGTPAEVISVKYY